MAGISLEVETRIQFPTLADAFTGIPFLKESLSRENSWTTIHYGHSLFLKDQILRIGTVRRSNGSTQTFLGWKGPDQGRFANIREELDEEITNGIDDSHILRLLGGQPRHSDPASVIDQLTRLNYLPFMEFSGNNRTGFYEPLQIHLKLMHCPVLQWPLLVELEKTASTLEETRLYQSELEQLIADLGLTASVIREEPPTLLYQTLLSPSDTPTVRRQP